MLDLQKEKDELQRAIDFERAEQDRLAWAAQWNAFENEMMKVKADADQRRRDQEAHVNHLAHKLEEQKRGWTLAGDDLAHKEAQIREKDNFQWMMWETEEKLKTMERSKFDDFKR